MADLAFDVLRQVAFAGRILDQDDLTASDDAALAVARGYFDTGIEIDDVLPPRRRVPIDVVLGLGFAEDDAAARQAFGQFAAAPLLDPFDPGIAEMRLAASIGVDCVCASASSSEKLMIGRWPCGVTRRR